MSDLIDRKKFIYTLIFSEKTKSIFVKDLRSVIEVANEMPSEKPEQTLESAIDYLQSTGWLQEHDRILTESTESARKKGKWIVHDYDLGRERYECAECKGRCDLEYNFCPDCGADMRGE